MGHSNVLLRIYYVKDFPLHTLLLEIRKGYFMEPENKFATAEEKDAGEEKNRWKFAVSSRQQTMKERSQGGWANLSKNDCILLLFLSSSPFFCSPRYVSNPCSLFLQKVCSANAFQKPFFKAQ